MREDTKIMVLVHPGSACGSADFNLGESGAEARNALAREIMRWDHDMLIVDGDLSREIPFYPVLAIAIEGAADLKGRRVVRETACDLTVENWPEAVARRFRSTWPGGPHDVHVTGAWIHEDGGGCVNAVVEKLDGHRITISDYALRLP